jgi:hypothetical protein
MLLGVEVEGQPDPERRNHWIIKLGPYEAHVTEEIRDDLKYYTYNLRIGAEYVVHSLSGVKNPEEAVSIIDKALRTYLLDKRKVEENYMPKFANGR